MNNKITYSNLENILKKAGFKKEISQGTHQIFKNQTVNS